MSHLSPIQILILVSSTVFFLNGTTSRAETSRPTATKKTPAARVVSLNGQALVGERKLKPGDTLSVGDIIRTKEKSSLKLLLFDETIVDLGSTAIFRVEKFNPNKVDDREVTLKIDLGKVRTSINKKLSQKGKFLIRTKASVLAVRGSEIFTNVADTPGGQHHETITMGEGKGALIYEGQPEAPAINLAPGDQANFNAAMGEQPGAPGSGPGPGYQPGANVTQVQNIEAVQNEYQTKDETFDQCVAVKENQEEAHPQEGRATMQFVENQFQNPAPTGEQKQGDGEATKGEAPQRAPATEGETKMADAAPPVDPTEIILDAIPNADGTAISGGLNYTPGVGGNNNTGNTAGSGTTDGQPNTGATEARDIQINVTFEPNS